MINVIERWLSSSTYCEAVALEILSISFQGVSPTTLIRARRGRSSSSPERSLDSYESTGNSTSNSDYWVPANVKAPSTLSKYSSHIASAAISPTSFVAINPGAICRLIDLGMPNPITMRG